MKIRIKKAPKKKLKVRVRGKKKTKKKKVDFRTIASRK